jgi:hypothetical protein
MHTHEHQNVTCSRPSLPPTSRFPRLPLDPPPPDQPLSELAVRVAALLLESGGKVAVFESTTAGLISAALQSVSGVRGPFDQSCLAADS